MVDKERVIRLLNGIRRDRDRLARMSDTTTDAERVPEYLGRLSHFDSFIEHVGRWLTEP